MPVLSYFPVKVKRKPIPFRYPGGKFYALNLLAPFWLNKEYDEYREPFVGGGSVFFSKPKSEFNILNDIDSELITTYRVMQNPELRERLIERVKNETASPDRWREVLELVPHSDLDIAFKYYYLNRTSFSGKLSSPAWGYRDKRSLPPHRWEERIRPCGRFLEGAELLNTDFEDVIRQAPRGNNVLIFVDPPYYRPTKKKHYRYGFNEEDHLRLAECLRRTPYDFFLTYEDAPEIRELYAWANLYKMQFTYRVDNSAVQNGERKNGSELIIANFRINTIGDQAMFEN